jgi:hypothetical protein
VQRPCKKESRKKVILCTGFARSQSYRFEYWSDAVDSSRAGTAFHVVARDPAGSWSLQNGAGGSLEAKVVAGHPLYDVAVLKVDEGETLKPLPLASEMLDGAKVEGAIVGAPGGGEVEWRVMKKP